MRKTKIIFWGFLVLLACAVMAAFAWFPSAQFVDAQTTRSDEEIRKRNRDKSVTDEKLVRVRDEASAVQASVFTLMKAESPKFSHFTGQVHDPKAQAVGRRGQTGFSLGWNKGDTRFFLNVSFVFNADEAGSLGEKSVNGISMGDFYPAPEYFGKGGIIVKNVELNQMVTRVSLHFWKGRLIVSSSLNNQSRSTLKNEKELLEIVEAIYPLLVAKEKFEDV